MGKRGIEPKIKEIHLRKIVYKTKHPEVYKVLEECIDDGDKVNSDKVNYWRVEGDRQLKILKKIIVKGQRHLTEEEEENLKIWKSIKLGCNRLIEYNVDQPPEILPEELIKGKDLFKGQPPEWLHNVSDSIREAYEREKENNTYLGKVNVTESMKFLLANIKGIERELNRRVLIKKPTKRTYDEDKNLEDDDIDSYDIEESKETNPLSNYNCPVPHSEHCKLCCWSKDCIQKETPGKLEPIQHPPKKDVNKIIDDFFANEKETTTEETVKQPTKKRESVYTSRKKKNTPILD